MGSDASGRLDIVEPDPDELTSLLEVIAGRRQRSITSRDSTPVIDGALIYETSCREELIKAGARPACTLAELDTSCNAMLPWLTDDLGTNTAAREISTVFSRQLQWWFSFRKSQCINRDSSQDAFSVYFAAHLRIDVEQLSQTILLDPSYKKSLQGMWQRIDARPHGPDGQPFSVYKD